MTELEERVESFWQAQLEDWKLAADNHAALANVQTRLIAVDGLYRIVQYNPERIRSSAASTDAAVLQARPCFFCNRLEGQESIPFNQFFDILVNPYPIFEHHLTIPLIQHESQQIFRYIEDMLMLAASLPDYFVFYNGPRCGASAPDHMHFQAARQNCLPFIAHCRQFEIPLHVIHTGQSTTLYRFHTCSPSGFLIASTLLDEAIAAFELVYSELEIKPGDYEPMMNILVWMEDNGIWNIAVFTRRELRPSCFYAEGDANLLISPATVEMAGMFITPREKDFLKVKGEDLKNILSEVCLTGEEMDRITRNIVAKL